jgi:RNA polymerase sigma factor (sigma-70 family)
VVFRPKYTVLEDHELVSVFREQGHMEIVGILYQRYGHLVFGLCLKYLKNKTEAQDAVIGIFDKLITDLKKHKVEHFKSWLYVYSKNYCLMELRKRQTALKREIELHENQGAVVEIEEDAHLKEKEDQLGMLEKAMQLLKEEQQICVDYFYLRKLSYQEVAAKTGYSVGEVKSHIQNGKRNLKIHIENLMNEQEKK